MHRHIGWKAHLRVGNVVCEGLDQSARLQQKGREIMGRHLENRERRPVSLPQSAPGYFRLCSADASTQISEKPHDPRSYMLRSKLELWTPSKYQATI